MFRTKLNIKINLISCTCKHLLTHHVLHKLYYVYIFSEIYLYIVDFNHICNVIL